MYYANLFSKTSCSKICVKFPIGPFCLGNGAYLDVMNLCVLSILIKRELLTKSKLYCRRNFNCRKMNDFLLARLYQKQVSRVKLAYAVVCVSISMSALKRHSNKVRHLHFFKSLLINWP